MRAELGFETIVTGYGLTECDRHRDDVPPRRRRRDDRDDRGPRDPRRRGARSSTTTGEPLAAGEPGEVVVRGYNVMQGYLDDPEATAEAIDADGWLHTGDVGVMDERGNLRITDRMKDMFIVGGFNAYPAEIEDMMLEHPGVVAGGGRRRARRRAWARSAWRSSCCAPAPSSTPTS